MKNSDNRPKQYTFERRAQSYSDGRFSIPAEICRKLEVKHEDTVYLTVKDLAGCVLFDGEKVIKSGTEIYGKEMSKIVRGSLIEVTVSVLPISINGK